MEEGAGVGAVVAGVACRGARSKGRQQGLREGHGGGGWRPARASACPSGKQKGRFRVGRALCY
eukprot:3911446-Rhodomonas_salina.1